MENLDKITNTIGHYKVKDLRWKPLDNIIVGLVECPYWGTDKRPFVSAQWNKQGKPIHDGKGREDLILNII